MPRYTVLLQRPDYASGNYGLDTFFVKVEATDPTRALTLARDEALAADGTEDGEDYACLLLIAGDHDDLNPEAV